MATGNTSNNLYFSVSEGKICRQFKSATGNSTERINKNGRVVHEEFYDYIDGIITGISVRESEYGKTWQVSLLDAGVVQVVQFNYSSGYANGFLKALPNVNFDKKVKIIPNQKIEGDKKKTTIFLNQDGQSLKWAFTKDNPNGLPELKQIKVKGKITWDDSDIMEFLEEMVNVAVIPQLSVVTTEVTDDTYSAVNQQEDEDCPF